MTRYAVTFVADQSMLAYAALAARAVYKTAKRHDVDIVIFTQSGLTDSALHEFCKPYRYSISIVEVDFKSRLSGSFDMGPISPAFWMLDVPYLLEPMKYQKILYLDPDIIIEGDVTKSFDINTKDHPFCAVEDFSTSVWKGSHSQSKHDGYSRYLEAIGIGATDRYFNSGVLLIDSGIWLEHDTGKKALTFAKENEHVLRRHDQTALNAVSIGRWGQLTPRWNFQRSVMDLSIPVPAAPRILHFHGGNKPWSGKSWRRELQHNEYFVDAFTNTPWEASHQAIAAERPPFHNMRRIRKKFTLGRREKAKRIAAYKDYLASRDFVDESLFPV